MHIEPNSPRGRSIWGPHILWMPEPALFAPIAYTAPASIKLVADNQDLLYLANLVDANPAILEKTILIARPFALTETARAMVNAATLPTDVIAAASWLHKAILKLRTDYPRLAELPIYWEGLNEPSREQIGKVTSFDIESALLAQRDGIRRLLGGFSEGTPDIIDYPAPERPTNDDWPTYYPALKAIHEVGPDVAMLHVHEYAVGVGAIQDKSKERNELLRQPWRVGRINKVYERHIRPHGWGIACVVSEGPLDMPNENIEEEMKIAWMTDPEIEKMYCDEVKAVNIYTMDADGWQHFSYNHMADQIFDQIDTYSPGDTIELPPEEEVPTGDIVVTTICPSGQNVRRHPSYKGLVIGEMNPGELGYISPEESVSIVQDYVGRDASWVHVKTASVDGFMAAWLLKGV